MFLMKKIKQILIVGGVVCLTVSAGCTRKKEKLPGEKTVKELMYDRYTVRTFDKDSKVKKDDLTKIVEAGLLSPSQNFRYGWRLLVFGDSEKSRSIMDKVWRKYAAYKRHCDENGKPYIEYLNAIKTAPVTLMLVGRSDAKLSLDDNNSSGSTEVDRLTIRDSMIAATAMMLQAEQLGYKTAFNSDFSLPKEAIKEIYGEKAKDNMSVYPIVMVGVGKPGPVFKKDELNSTNVLQAAPKINMYCEEGEAKPKPRFKVVSSDGEHAVITKDKDIGSVDRKINKEFVKVY